MSGKIPNILLKVKKSNHIWSARIYEEFIKNRIFASTGCPQQIHSESRNYTCGELNSKHVGEKITLRGFLMHKRMGLFCVLRDSFGRTQVIVDPELSTKLEKITYESYVQVFGTVVKRPESQIKLSESTGEVEVKASSLQILNLAKKQIPFLIRSNSKPTFELSSKYRYLYLRNENLQKNLRFRSKIGKLMRDYLQDDQNFIEINTPCLSAATPGGAQEFKVPSRIKDKFYSLVQSPQVFKQLAVIGGFEKYFQFAVCFRDEGGKEDRQPEFMQLDLEMSNVNSQQVQQLLEETLRYSWPQTFPPLPAQFPRVTYEYAIQNYGTDKPDTRFDWKILDFSGFIRFERTEIGSSSVDPLKSSINPVNFLKNNSIDSESKLSISANSENKLSVCTNSENSSQKDLKLDKAVHKAFIIPDGSKYLKKSNVAAWKFICENELKFTNLDVFIRKNGRFSRILKAKGTEILNLNVESISTDSNLGSKNTLNLNSESKSLKSQDLNRKSESLKSQDLNRKSENLNIWSSNNVSLDLEKVQLNENDALVFSYGVESEVLKLLGRLRLLAAEILESNGAQVRDHEKFNFLWVIDFPLFEKNYEGNLVSCHHPFTAPKLEPLEQVKTDQEPLENLHTDKESLEQLKNDLELFENNQEHLRLLKNNPLKVKSEHYDLVLNGCEIAGGSIRNHDSKLQREILDLLKIDTSSMGFLLEALECGAPPHGGIALGFDRYISILLGLKNIRDVIAFPKTSEAKCLMSGAPAPIEDRDKSLYHMR